MQMRSKSKRAAAHHPALPNGLRVRGRPGSSRRDLFNRLTSVGLFCGASYVKGMAKAPTVLFAVLTLVIAAVGLVPKFDAVVVEKSANKATIKE